jgi:L-cysteine S-thiosulfotransferase
MAIISDVAAENLIPKLVRCNNLKYKEDVMRKRAALVVITGLTGLLALGPVQFASATDEVKKEETGKQIAFNNKKGNCLACHAMPTVPDAEAPGNIAPPLIGMKARFPDKAKLREVIWDQMKFNPRTAMPPFGKHKILTEEEIDKVTDFIYTL